MADFVAHLRDRVSRRAGSAAGLESAEPAPLSARVSEPSLPSARTRRGVLRYRGNRAVPSATSATVPDLEKLARRLIPRLLNKHAAESEQTEDADWMHLLTRYLQAQSGRAAPTMDRPRGLRLFAEGFSLHAGVFSLRAGRRRARTTRSNDALGTALVRRFHCTESPWTRTARSSIERSTQLPALPGG